jgi:hypothetical protein
MKAIKFNTETQKYEIGTVRKGKFTAKDTGSDSKALELKYKARVVFYDGTYSWLQNY